MVGATNSMSVSFDKLAATAVYMSMAKPAPHDAPETGPWPACYKKTSQVIAQKKGRG